jgi:hypothetical protein
MSSEIDFMRWNFPFNRYRNLDLKLIETFQVNGKAIQVFKYQVIPTNYSLPLSHNQTHLSRMQSCFQRCIEILAARYHQLERRSNLDKKGFMN